MGRYYYYYRGGKKFVIIAIYINIIYHPARGRNLLHIKTQAGHAKKIDDTQTHAKPESKNRQKRHTGYTATRAIHYNANNEHPR